MYSKSEPEPRWSWVAWARGFTVWISSFLLESLNAWFWDNSDHYIWLFISRKCCYASEFKNHVFFFFLVILILLTFTCPLPAIYLVSLRLKKNVFCVMVLIPWLHFSCLFPIFPSKSCNSLRWDLYTVNTHWLSKQLHHRTRWCWRNKAHTRSLGVMKIHHKFQKLKKYHKISSHFVPATMIFILKGFC